MIDVACASRSRRGGWPGPWARGGRPRTRGPGARRLF